MIVIMLAKMLVSTLNEDIVIIILLIFIFYKLYFVL